jgi:hypothetical protein
VGAHDVGVAAGLAQDHLKQDLTMQGVLVKILSAELKGVIVMKTVPAPSGGTKPAMQLLNAVA